jgi:serine protein kinase
MSVLLNVTARFNQQKTEDLSMDEYLELIKTDKMVYANAAERMLSAIGSPTVIDSATDPSLSRIFANRNLKYYEPFKDFYGMESVIEQIVSYFTHSAQGLEEQKQILYLLGPVGSAKSSLAEKLKELMEVMPIYVLTLNGVMSPVFESPLGLFTKKDSDELGISSRYLHEHLSPWAVKRLKEIEGDISKFRVTKVYPNQARQIAISKTEPGDENNQDISALVGKIDIRKLAKFSQNDPDAYSFSGGLCLSNQGLLEFVEMFKAPIKVLHPLLTATQEGNYNGTEALSGIPFEGIILAHSNESEWETFKNDKNNEAFIDRISIVKVPYVLRMKEEVRIYKKHINNSSLVGAVVAPETFEILARFAVLSRLTEASGLDQLSKLQVYDGENIKDQDAKAKSYYEYKTEAGQNEGMSGISTRFSYKVLSRVFNFIDGERSANPVHLLYVLREEIDKAQFNEAVTIEYKSYIDKLETKYAKQLGLEIQRSYFETYDEYGQNLFDRYIILADNWLQDTDYRDPDTKELFDKRVLDEELTKVEKRAEVVNYKDFRNEVVSFALRHRANNKGNNPNWKNYAKLRSVIEKNMFDATNDMTPIISFSSKESKDNAKKHSEFVKRMTEKGYTEKQVRQLVEWYIRVRHKL